MTVPELHILPTPQDTALATAEFVGSLAEKRARTQGRFVIALSGGSTPRRLYQLLASPPYAARIAWDRWHVFWSDERCVPPAHPDSNYRMVRESLLDYVPIPANHIHRIRGEATPEDAAEEYEQELRQVFPPSTPVFDLVLLGIGEDGHSASLFVGTDAIQEKQRLVMANRVPHLQAHRITFTFPLINAASATAFLVTEGSKAEVLRQVLEPKSTDPVLPAALVRPTSGTVHWFLARDAAACLRRQAREPQAAKSRTQAC